MPGEYPDDFDRQDESLEAPEARESRIAIEQGGIDLSTIYDQMTAAGSYEKYTNGIPEQDRNKDAYWATVKAASGLVNGGDRSSEAFKAAGALLSYRETLAKEIEANPPTKDAFNTARAELATCASAHVYLDAEKALHPQTDSNTEAKEKA